MYLYKEDAVYIIRSIFSYELAETYGLESESILQTANLWRKNVNAIIGPQETCNHEAR